MIRAGQPAEDVASSTGWELARVRRFEGPVLAEREHLVGLAQRAAVRANGRTDGSHTLERRVRERLQSRGVDLTAVTWDAARGEAHGPWTVIVAFAAGGKERRAAWHYNVPTRSLEALDDEARWLSEDEQALPGGLAGHPLLGSAHGEDEAAADLMATMRERRQRRGRRSQPGPRRPEDSTSAPGPQIPNEVLPLEDLPYDPQTMGDPPAAHPRPGPEAEGDVEVEPEVDVSPEVEVSPDVAAPEPEPVSPEEAQRAVGRSPGRRRGKLRLPKVTVVPEQDQEEEPEVSFARVHHDPREVTFDEFFGTDDEVDEPETDGTAAAVEEVGAHDVDVAVEADSDVTSGGDEPPGVEVDGAEESGEEAVDGELSSEEKADAAPKKGRTSVPSWDDIMFGARDRR